MDQLIQNLQQKITELSERSFFNQPATLAVIAKCEEVLGIKLPEIVKTFYLNYNGGFFAAADIEDEYLDDPDEVEWMRWNSNYILSLQDVIDTYHFNGDLPAFDIRAAERDSGRRFMPLVHTSGQELLLLDLTDVTNEIPVIDAFHEVNFRDWKVLYPSFEAFLNDYIQKEGMIEAVAS
ncbi:MAG TPA: SMI1/KNR4 family protein [Bacillota bacterium]|jgi:hypothetical protein|nr:SMI1/KNR4 family protein [Bacillota bacterium]